MNCDSCIHGSVSDRKRRLLLLLLIGIAVAQFRTELSFLQRSLGRKFAEMDGFFAPSSSGFVVDILSIGSESRIEFLRAQQDTFGSHVSVRHFFNATEADDDDPHCNSNLKPNYPYEISTFCKSRSREPDVSYLRRFLGNYYAHSSWLKQKANAIGWMCAQRRPLHGLYKVLQSYRAGQEVLPDFLILMDDDTYFSLEQFQRMMVEEAASVSEPTVFAGCLVRFPIWQVNFTFPFGGHGTIFNKASLQRMLEPIYCHQGANNETCAQLEQDMIGERKIFRNGMSVVDLIQAYVSYQPYKDVATWTDGYCMHSDWVLGFFVNHYNISSHVKIEYFANVPQARMEEWHGSVIYKKPEGFCQNINVEHCQADDVACHYMTPTVMTNYTNIVKEKAPPGQFLEKKQ